MGANSSKSGPTKQDFDELAKTTHFSVEEISKLCGSFKQIAGSTTADGKIDVNEFANMLGIRSIGFAGKIFAAFDSNPDKSLDFKEYVEGLSAISARATLEERATFIFNVYDADRGGTISSDELMEVMKLSLGENSDVKIPDTALNRIVKDTIKKMDQNDDGEISLDEFIDAAKKNPSILNCVNIDIEKILQN